MEWNNITVNESVDLGQAARWRCDSSGFDIREIPAEITLCTECHAVHRSQEPRIRERIPIVIEIIDKLGLRKCFSFIIIA